MDSVGNDKRPDGYRTRHVQHRGNSQDGGFDAEVARGTFSTTTTIDWRSGNKQAVTLGANVTFNFTAPPGIAHLLLKLTQNGTGSRIPGWPATVKWAGGTEPAWSTAGSAVDIISLY